MSKGEGECARAVRSEAQEERVRSFYFYIASGRLDFVASTPRVLLTFDEEGRDLGSRTAATRVFIDGTGVEGGMKRDLEEAMESIPGEESRRVREDIEG